MKLKKVILILARCPAIRFLFTQYSIASLHFGVRLLGLTAGMVAILLRRASVLKDFFPGDSDFDLTCVFKDLPGESVPPGLRLYRRIRFLLPFTREIKWVNLKDFEIEMKYFACEYDDARHWVFLYPKHPFPLPLPKPLVATHVLYTAFRIYRQTVLKFLFGPYAALRETKQSLFARSLIKTFFKLKHLSLRINSHETLPPLDYRSIPGSPLSFVQTAPELKTLIRKFYDCLPQDFEIPESDEPELEFKIGGYESSRLELLGTQLKSLFGNLRSKSGPVDIRSADLSFRRLLNFELTVNIELASDVSVADPALYRTIQNALKCFFKRHDAILDVPYPVIYGPALRNWVAQADPFAALLRQNLRFDLVAGGIRGDKAAQGHIKTEFLRRELSESLRMLASYLRGNQTALLLELVFGRLVVYNRLLSENILHLSCESLGREAFKHDPLTDSEAEYLRFYQKSDHQALRKISILRVWRDLKGLIERELKMARTHLKALRCSEL